MPDHFERLKATLADRYALERELGAGGMATVYLARDRKHDRRVAVKVLNPELAASLGGERFLREIQVTAQLSHPHILPLYDSGEAGRFLYYVMPFVEGESLADLIAREKQLPIKDAVQVAREVAEALAHAHSHGLIHRDIKPQNILMSGGHAIVADFGIATAVSQAGGEKLTETGTTIGTAAYMSPEQGMGSDQLDGRSDIYSLACVLYEMLVGQVPFTGTTAQQVIARHSMDHVPPPHIMRNTIPEDLEQIILRAMAKLPADRYRTALEMAEALAAVDTTTVVHRVSPTLQMLARRRRLRRTLLPVAGVLGAIVLAGAGWVLLGQARNRDRAAAGGLDLRRIAVLYFDDLSRDSSLTPIADGLTEGLIEELARVPGLSVISRNGSAPWRHATASRDSIARALGAGTLVMGEVARARGSQLEITTRLVDGATGVDVSRGRVELPMDALLSARDSVARDVARFLRERLGEELELRERRAGTSSAVAWTLVQQAEQARESAVDRLVQGDAEAAIARARLADSLLAEAERADPQWIEPVRLRGQVAYLLASASRGRSERTLLVRQGLEYAGRALRLDPGDARARELRGMLRYWTWTWDLEPDHARRDALLDSAQADLDAAVRADPSLASAHATLSRLYYAHKDLVSAVLAAQRAYEADAYLRDAARILSLLHSGSYNIMQFGEAHRWCDEGSRRFPRDYRFADCQLWVMTMPGADVDLARAWRLAEQVDSLAPAAQRTYLHYQSQVLIGGIIGRAGLQDSAERVFQRVQPDDPGMAGDLKGLEAAMRAINGDADQAIALLKRYVVGNPGHSFQVGGVLHWWWRDLERHPEFRQVLSSTH